MIVSRQRLILKRCLHETKFTHQAVSESKITSKEKMLMKWFLTNGDYKATLSRDEVGMIEGSFAIANEVLKDEKLRLILEEKYTKGDNQESELVLKWATTKMIYSKVFENLIEDWRKMRGKTY